MQATLSMMAKGSVVVSALLAAAVSSSSAFAQPRLNVRAVEISGPAEAIEGRSVSVTATFDSTGADDPASFRWSLFLTMGGVLDGAVPLGTFGRVTLHGATPEVVTRSVTLPAAVTGRYALAIVADVDDDVAEFDELDNVAFASQTIFIRDELPDFAVTSVRPQERARQVGETLHFDFTVANLGERSGTVTVSGYLSDDGVVSTADALIGTADVTVGAGQTVSGVISGPVPAGFAPGDYSIAAIADVAGAVEEISETNNIARASRAVNVFTTTLDIGTVGLPEGSLAIAYYVLLEASGGNGHYSWRLASGQLPPGLTLDGAQGVITGVPSASGTFEFHLEVDSNGTSADRAYTVQIHDTGAELTIVTRNVIDGAIGHPYEQILVAAGGEPPYSWQLLDTSNVLPPGLDLGRQGVITGVPNTLGTFNFGVVVTDNKGARDQVMLQISVSPPVNVLVLQHDPPPTTVGVPMDFALQVTGGVAPYHWEALSTPPPGLTVTEQGHLTGTPSQVGRFPVRVRATDSTRAGNNDTQLVQVVVEDDGALRVKTAGLPQAILRSRFEAVLEAEGGQPPLVWSIVPGDHLPDGFFMVQGDGTTHPTDTAVIRGTAVRSLFHAFAVQVQDAYGRRAQKVLLIEVPPPAPAASSGCVCVDGSRSASNAVLIAIVVLGLAWVRRRA